MLCSSKMLKILLRFWENGSRSQGNLKFRMRHCQFLKIVHTHISACDNVECPVLGHHQDSDIIILVSLKLHFWLLMVCAGNKAGWKISNLM